jgi:hypothetical protein
MSTLAATFAPRLAAAHSVARSGAYTPRKDRPMAWGRKAHDARMNAPAPGESLARTTVEAACAMINASFSAAAHHNTLKLAVETAMLRGAWSMPVRCRYHRIAFDADVRSVEATVLRLNKLIDAERRHNALLRNNGLAPMVKRVPDNLLEARLFCRWFRRYGARAQWPLVLDALTTRPEHAPPYSLEAAE